MRKDVYLEMNDNNNKKDGGNGGLNEDGTVKVSMKGKEVKHMIYIDNWNIPKSLFNRVISDTPLPQFLDAYL